MTEVNTHTYRQTKIIATIGPSTDSEDSIRGLIKAGVDVMRLNFSHSDKNIYFKFFKLSGYILF